MRPLSARERELVVLYAQGFTGRQVAEAIGLKVSTVYTNVKKARLKYEAAGVDVSTKLKLRAQLVKEGLIHE